VSPQLISRRSTLQGLAVSIVGGIAGFFVARSSGAAKSKAPTTAANGYGAAAAGGGTLLAALSQVPAGGGLILAKDKIVLISGAGGTVHGFSAVCTHQGCTVNSVSGEAISCPCHGSRFDAQTGAVIAGPAPSPLPKIPVTVRGNNVYTG
jgi:Rieske Fe-S protein